MIFWNQTLTNNGNETDPCPWMSSNVKYYLDHVTYPMLPDDVKNVIKGKQMQLESRYSSEGALTDSTSAQNKNMGNLWVPSEYEVLGSVLMSTNSIENSTVQYPLFANSYKHRIKTKRNDGHRWTWWLSCAYNKNNTYALYINSSGAIGACYVNRNNMTLLCFRTM